MSVSVVFVSLSHLRSVLCAIITICDDDRQTRTLCKHHEYWRLNWPPWARQPCTSSCIIVTRAAFLRIHQVPSIDVGSRAARACCCCCCLHFSLAAGGKLRTLVRCLIWARQACRSPHTTLLLIGAMRTTTDCQLPWHSNFNLYIFGCWIARHGL